MADPPRCPCNSGAEPRTSIHAARQACKCHDFGVKNLNQVPEVACHIRIKLHTYVGHRDIVSFDFSKGIRV